MHQRFNALNLTKKSQKMNEFYELILFQQKKREIILINN